MEKADTYEISNDYKRTIDCYDQLIDPNDKFSYKNKGFSYQ